MGWIPAIATLVIVAVAGGWFWAAVAARAEARRNRAPVRGPFLAGVLCGMALGVALTARRRGLNALGASSLNAVLRRHRVRSGISLDGVAVRVLTGAAGLVRAGPASTRARTRNVLLKPRT